MTDRRSLRTQLSVAILLLTGLVAVLAVQLGMRILRSNVVDNAVAEQASALDAGEAAPESLVEVSGIDEGDGEILLEEAPVEMGGVASAEGFEATIGDTFGLEPGEANELEVDYLRSLVAEFELLPDLVAEFGDPNDRVNLLLSTGAIVALEGEGYEEMLEIDVSQTVLSAESILSIAGSIFDVGPNDPADRTFTFGSTSVDGRSVGFVVDVGDQLRALDKVADALWLSAALLTVLAGTAAWFLVGRALQPVGAITARVNQITSGSLSERVPVPNRQDEIALLADTINAMLGRLEHEDLKRRQFVSDASHELRTPVAVLQNEAQVGLRAPESTTVNELSEVVLEESRRLGSLVEDLLALSRNDERRSGSVGNDRTSTGPNVDIDDVLLEESRRSRGVLVDRSGVSAGRIVGRRSEVERCLTHLLDNAARHADSRIAVGVSTDQDVVVCWVDDDGPGVAIADRSRIFDRFVRLDEARDRDRGGAGLGLAVVKATVDSLGGVIEVLDAPLGGARFEIRWPAAEVLSSAPPTT